MNIWKELGCPGWSGWLGAAGVLLAGAGLARSQYERRHFSVEETRLVSPKLRQERTLVFLSDLHDNTFGEGNRELLGAIRRVEPDAVLIGGDTMVVKPGKADLQVTKELIGGLARLGCPIYYANGNHEQRMRKERSTYGALYQQFKKLLQDFGVHHLEDQTAYLGEDIAVSGLEIDRRFYRDFFPDQMEPGYIRRRLGKADPERFQVLLAHSPLFLDAYAGWGADLSLAGHFHGGTIRLPFLGGVMTPQYQFFLPYCAGTFTKDGKTMIVSRGLGTHSINIRFCNKPQVVVLRLLPET